MKTSIILFCLCVFAIQLSAQDQISINDAEIGIKLDDKIVYISKENRRLLTDFEYRKYAYPTKYQFELLPTILERGEIHLALWHLINLYPSNPIFTLKLVKELSTLDLIHSDAFIEAFHTYAYTDPSVSRLIDGQYELFKPELLDIHISATNLLAKWTAKMQ